MNKLLIVLAGLFLASTARAEFILQPNDFTALAAADSQACVFVDDDSDPSNGGFVRKEFLERPNVINVSWCGAIRGSGFVHATTNRIAIQAAIDLISTDVGYGIGGEILVDGRYDLDQELTVSEEGVTIRGTGINSVWIFTQFKIAPSILVFNNTEGSMIRVTASSFTLRDIRILASHTRYLSDYGARKIGIHLEPLDNGSSGSRVNNPRILNVQVIKNPGPALAVIDNSVGAHIEDFVASANHGPGILIDRGEAVNRQNIISRPGIVTIINTRVTDNGGHGVQIGTNTATVFNPYRIHIVSLESYRNAGVGNSRDSGGVLGQYDFWAHGENITIENSAFSGRDKDNIDNQIGTVFVAGANITLRNNRYIAPKNHAIRFDEISGGTPSNGIIVSLGYSCCNTFDPIEEFVSFKNGVENCQLFVPWRNAIANLTTTAANCNGYVNLEN